jgi:hypothetical protein
LIESTADVRERFAAVLSLDPVVADFDELGWITITLPVAPDAYAVAAAVAAVERLPAAVANELWNFPSWKLATGYDPNSMSASGEMGGVRHVVDASLEVMASNE